MRFSVAISSTSSFGENKLYFCISVIQNCKTYGSGGSICNVCNNGYIPTTSKTQCSIMINNCQYLNSPSLILPSYSVANASYTYE